MSSSLNRVQIIGKCGRDPETRFTSAGEAICTLNIATQESWKDKVSGERKEAVEWHRCILFGRLGEIADQHLRKGSQVYLEGSLRTRKWMDKDGKERYTTEIRVDVMKMLGSRQVSDSSSPATSKGNSGGGGGNDQGYSDPSSGPKNPNPDFSGSGDDYPFVNASCINKAEQKIRRHA